MDNSEIKSLSTFVWSIAEKLRGDFKQFEYGKIVLPFVVLRRLDCILEETKAEVLKVASTLPQGMDDTARDTILYEVAGKNIQVYNLSEFTFASIKGQEAKDIHKNILDYITKFSSNIRDIFLEKFKITDQLKRLNEANLLFTVFEEFSKMDLHPNSLSNLEMGYLFEELIRKFSEISNETAGEHYTPREVINLIVSLLLAKDKDALAGTGVIRQIYDPAAGTGGMLSTAEMEIKALNPGVRVELFGQELNPESFAICKSDMLVTGHNPGNIAFGNTLKDDAHRDKSFHYMISNPPYGVEWKKYKETITKEAKDQGYNGRFGAGLPRVSDGQLLFLQHMISKMRDDHLGSRIGIVMNGSPLFTGGAGSGESEIRRWMFENDWVEAIIALPSDLFYNTGIQTYVWLLSNRKATEIQGKVQMIDASGDRFWKSMKKSLGSKRREIPERATQEITQIYSDMPNAEAGWDDVSKVFSTDELAYREVRVERPLRLAFEVSQEGLDRLKEVAAFTKQDDKDQMTILSILENDLPEKRRWMDREDFEESLADAFISKGLKPKAPVQKAILTSFSVRDEAAAVCKKRNGKLEPDTSLRDHELVPMNEHWKDYFEREVLPFAPDAWVDETYVDKKDGQVGRIGYEVSFNSYFYKYIPPRALEDIEEELKVLETEIKELLIKVAN